MSFLQFIGIGRSVRPSMSRRARAWSSQRMKKQESFTSCTTSLICSHKCLFKSTFHETRRTSKIEHVVYFTTQSTSNDRLLAPTHCTKSHRAARRPATCTSPQSTRCAAARWLHSDRRTRAHH
jgi:hypothetical protein